MQKHKVSEYESAFIGETTKNASWVLFNNIKSS